MMKTDRRWLGALSMLCLAGAAGAQTSPRALPETPRHLDFEAGQPGQVPEGWSLLAVSAQAGYRFALSADRPQEGELCAELEGGQAVAAGGFGGMVQAVSAEPYRGRRVRFRAAVRTAEGQAQLWMRVDRAQGMGYFDNMADRPIRSEAWIDAASFELVDDGPEPVDAPRALTPRGLENLAAFARLLGHVRYFHPSDEAARADWNSFAVGAVERVEDSADAAELAERLGELFRPLAPALSVFPCARPPAGPPPTAAAETPEARVAMWRHRSLSDEGSERVWEPAPGGRVPEGFPDPRAPLRVELGGGVAALVPLTLYGDALGTLPRAPAGPAAETAPAQTAGRPVRLAAVILAWSALEHFYPYFDVVVDDWHGELLRALRDAAADPDDEAFLRTLRRMLAGLRDGHAMATRPGAAPRFGLPLTWDWIDGELVITAAAAGAPVSPADVVHAIDGRPVSEALAAAEALVSGATPQAIRLGALRELELGQARAVTLEVEPAARQGTRASVTLERTLAGAFFSEPRPEQLAELEPDIVYLNLDSLDEEELEGALPRLAQARGIVFDLRGYPTRLDPFRFFGHLSEQPLRSAQWHLPAVTAAGMSFERGGEWEIEPRPPFLGAPKVFLTDARAVSFAETCLGIVEHYGLGEIAGGATAGTNGNVRWLELPGGFRVRFTALRVLKHDGSTHHGVGIRPTLPVARTRAGIAAGRDEVLESAVEWLKAAR